MKYSEFVALFRIYFVGMTDFLMKMYDVVMNKFVSLPWVLQVNEDFNNHT